MKKVNLYLVILLFFTLSVSFLPVSASASVSKKDLEQSARLPIEEDVPEEMLRFVGEYLGEVEEVETALMKIQYDEEITSFGGGYPTYMFDGVSAEDYCALDGKSILPVMTYRGRTFISYTKSGQAKSAFVVTYLEEKAQYTILKVGMAPRPLIDAIHALCEAHSGRRNLVVNGGGFIVYDITEERQYVVCQTNAAGLDLSPGSDLSNVPYYNEVLPMSDYVGYKQRVALAASDPEMQGKSGSASLYEEFQPYPPINGEPVYRDTQLLYIFLGGGLVILSVLAVIFLRKRGCTILSRLR